MIESILLASYFYKVSEYEKGKHMEIVTQTVIPRQLSFIHVPIEKSTMTQFRAAAAKPFSVLVIQQH
jgi:hypothetical protein